MILFVPKQTSLHCISQNDVLVVRGQVYRACWWKRKVEETMKLIKQFKACALCAHISTGNVESYQKQSLLKKNRGF